MGAAIITGLFAVVLACLAWVLQNGSRRARLLSRIERYTLVLKDLPDGHPARAHLDAALAADSAQLLALTGWKAPPSIPAPVEPSPAYPPDDIDWMGDEPAPGIPSSPPATPAQPPVATPIPQPRRSSMSGHGSTVLWALAGLSAVAAVGLVINDIFA